MNLAQIIKEIDKCSTMIDQSWDNNNETMAIAWMAKLDKLRQIRWYQSRNQLSNARNAMREYKGM